MTTRPLQVLLLESHPFEGAEAEAALAAAGHEVVRCHGPSSDGFPCAGLVDRAACPLRAGVDVAVDVRRARDGDPTALEDGVGCALRGGVPVVEVAHAPGDGGSSPFGRWTTPTGPDLVASAEAASAGAFDGLRAEIVARIEPLFVANGVPALPPTPGTPPKRTIECEIERDGRRLIVHLVGPPVGSALRQAASVRAYDVVREGDRTFDEIRLGYRPVVPLVGATR